MSNTVFDNKVIEDVAKDLLATSINARSLMTIDDSLAETDGMIKTINTYTYTGKAEELADGAGNSTRGSISYVGHDYTVKVVQQAFDYTDSDFAKDKAIVDMGLKGATSVMKNKMTTDFYAALGAAEGITFPQGTAISYDVIVDAISELNVEDESGIFVIIPNAWKAALRKDPDYVAAHNGDVVYNGQIGTICGVPVVATKALTDEAFVLTKEAVTLFIKKELEVEQDRDKDTRTNSIYLRDWYVCALTDATKVCKITEALA